MNKRLDKSAIFASSRWLIGGAFLIGVLAEPSGASGGGGPSSDADALATTKHISDTMMSPYCPGLTLSACPSDDARVLRGEIEEMVRQNVPEGAIRDKLEKRFHRDLSGEPSAWTSWLPPALFVALGAVFIIWNFFVKKPELDSPSTEERDN